MDTDKTIDMLCMSSYIIAAMLIISFAEWPLPAVALLLMSAAHLSSMFAQSLPREMFAWVHLLAFFFGAAGYGFMLGLGIIVAVLAIGGGGGGAG